MKARVVAARRQKARPASGRAAQGIVEVAWAVRRPFPFQKFRQVYTSHSWFQALNLTQACDRVQAYLLDRIRAFDWAPPVPPRDLIDAVLACPGDDLVDVMNRIVGLHGMNGNQALIKAAKVIERTSNILKSAPATSTSVDASLLKEPLERALWNLYDANKSRVSELIRSQCYAEATQAYGELFYEPLHQFFDHVMVNVKEEPIRRNRLALMKAIHALYTEQLADLSKLSILHTEVTQK